MGEKKWKTGDKLCQTNAMEVIYSRGRRSRCSEDSECGNSGAAGGCADTEIGPYRRTEHDIRSHGTMMLTSASPRWKASRNRLGLWPGLLIEHTVVPERCRKLKLPRPVRRLEDGLSEE